MGVLYAKVNGVWEPVASGGGAGDFLPLGGGTLTGPLHVEHTGECSLIPNSGDLQVGLGTGPGGAVVLAMDNDEIQCRDQVNGTAWPMSIQPHGGTLYVGGNAANAALKLLGVSPIGTPLDFFVNGLRCWSIFPGLTAPPADLIIQGIEPNANNIRIQSGGYTQIEVNSPAETVARFRATSTDRLRIISQTGATWSYISFYPAFEPHRVGLIGIYNDAHMALCSDAAANAHIYIGSGSGYILFGQGLPSAFTEWARFDANGLFLIGKTVGGIGTEGYQAPQGAGADFQTTNSVLNTPCFIANKVGAGVGTGSDFHHFRLNNTTIGSIVRSGTTSAVVYNTTSDYRLKNDHGLITGARERIAVLKPRRIVWKDDPTETEMDGFFAHEVAEVVPDAVTGDKDAVADEDDEEHGYTAGEIIPQQLDASKLIPLLVAALQEALGEIDDLKARVAQLEGAA